MLLFDRQAVLTIDGKEYKSDDMDFEFEVPFSTENEPDVSEISIYNLSPKTIASIHKGSVATLSAGYNTDIGMIVSGQVAGFTTQIDEVDKKTVLKVASAINEWKEKKINRSYAAGTTAKDIMMDLISGFGVTVADIEPVKNVTYSKGKTVSGRLKDVVKAIAKETESKFYIQKDRAYIRPYDKGTATGFLLSAVTGLIGSPEQIEVDEDGKQSVQGWSVECLLNHNIFEDSIIAIESKLVKGNFRVVKGSHTSEWTTKTEVVECR